MLIVRMLLPRKRDSTTQTPRPAIIVRAFRGRHANTAAVGAKCRNLSQLSHELTGQYETVAHLPDNRQDAGLRSGFWRTDWTGGIGLRIRCSRK